MYHHRKGTGITRRAIVIGEPTEGRIIHRTIGGNPRRGKVNRPQTVIPVGLCNEDGQWFPALVLPRELRLP